MTHQTRISAKGQVVIPKDVRDRLHWEPGTELEVIEGSGGITLRPKLQYRRLTVDEALARMAEISAPYRPTEPLPIEEISSVPVDVLRRHYAREFPAKGQRK